MCLILLALDSHPRFRLVMAANRDEFHARPTAAAGWWSDAPGLLAGRDLRAGGTWMGVTRGGRVAAVTNYREPVPPQPDAPSRGALVTDFLRADADAVRWAGELEERAAAYAGFNLLVDDGAAMTYVSNRGGLARTLVPGVYGLSNALLDTPWPKVVRGRAGLHAALDGYGADDTMLEDALFRLLADAEPAADALLPDTGVGAERERMLSSLFIRSPEYGTRASTVLLVGRDGAVRFTERRIDPASGEWAESRFAFAAERAAAGERV